MPRAVSNAARVEGLGALRRGLREMGDRGALREVQTVTRRAAQTIAGEARGLAPRATGRLAGSIRGTTAGNAGVVRSPLPYAAVQEWGGTIRPRGVPIKINRNLYVHEAADRRMDDVARDIAAGLDSLARRHGWR